MYYIDNVVLGLSTALSLGNLFYCFLGVFLGTAIGVLPGLGPVATIAMLLPITYGLDPTTALIMLAGIYYGAQYGGSTTAILINLPGESSAVVATLDGHQMARNGRAGVALATAAIGSFVAGTIATCVIVLFAPILAGFAIEFGAAEYFALMVLGLIASVVLATGSLFHALAMILIGILLGFVGIDVNSGLARYSFGSMQLSDGIDFVVIAMGVFGLGEIMANIHEQSRQITTQKVTSLWPTRADYGRMWKPILRGTGIGSVLGVLPGGGALLSAFAAYSIEKRVSPNSHEFGHGAIEGIAAPESANNAGAQTSFIPMLTLGIPGSGTTAVLLGALMLYNITPGPMLFTERPEVAGGLIASLYIGNLVLLALNLPLAGLFAKTLTMPRWVLVPGIAILAFVGVYQLHSDLMAIYLMLIVGVFGYALRKLGFSLAPVILGYVLGGLMEDNLRRALSISGGEVGILWDSAISIGLWIAAAILLVLPWLLSRAFSRKSPVTA